MYNSAKIVLIIVLITSAILAKAEGNSIHVATIKGKIVNVAELRNGNITGLQLLYKDVALNREERIKIAVSQSGDFSVDVPVPYPINVELKLNYISSIALVATPGKTAIMRCKIERGRLVAPEFYGPKKDLNRIVAAYSNTRYDLIGQSYANLAMIIGEPEKAKAISYALHQRIAEGVEAMLMEQDASTAAIRWVCQDMEYELHRNLLRAELDNVRKKPTDLPDNCCLFLDSIAVNFDPKIMSSSYIDLMNEVRNYLYLNISKAMHPTELAMKEVRFYELNLSQAARDILLTNTVMQHLERRSAFMLQSYLPIYFTKVKSSYLKQRVEKIYQGIQPPLAIDLAEPTPLPEQQRLMSDSRILEEIRTKHKGKLVYIDFWATWCKPCVRQFEHARRLKQELQYKDVAFVYLCAMSKEQEWQKMVQEHDLKGDHYLLDKKEYDTLSKIFSQRGFPHYSILNEQGTIAYKNARRPSEMGDLLRDIDNLMQ